MTTRLKNLSTALLALSALAVGAVQPAFATDQPFNSGQMRWDGIYVGIHAGGARSETSIRDATPNASAIAPPFGAFSCAPAFTGNYCTDPFELDASGYALGGQAGYNWSRGPIVFGIETEFGGSDISKTDVLIRPFNDRDMASTKYHWYSTLTGRLGYSLGTLLLYTKAGIAFAEIEHFASDIDLIGGVFQIFTPDQVNSKETYTGWTVGGGFSYAVSNRISLGVEYQYMDFGKEKATNQEGGTFAFDNELQVLKARLNFHLNK